METFKDNKGRTWKLKVTFPVLRTMKDEGILDLLSERDPITAIPLFVESDPIQQIDAIGIAIEQTKGQAQSFEPYDFAEALDEEVIWHGVNAFLGSLADFYPTHAKLIHEVLTQAQAKMDKSRAVVTEMTTSGKLGDMIQAAMDNAATDGSLPTVSPATSG